MSKKHFIALADALKVSRPPLSVDSSALPVHVQWWRDVETIASACLATSNSFDYARFIAHVKGGK